MGELAGLTADLPVEPARVARTGDEAAAAPVPAAATHRAGLRATWAAWATAVLVTSVIWLIAGVSDGDLGYYWPAGPLTCADLARFAVLALRPGVA